MVRIAVIGAGPGGIAAAAGLSERGHDVTLATRSAERLHALTERGGVEVDDAKGTRFVALATTTDLGTAVGRSTVVLVAVPAYGQEEIVAALAEHLKPGTALVLMPGSCGSLVAAGILRRVGRDPQSEILLAETITLPFSGRMTGPSSVRVVLPSRLRAAAFPSRRNNELFSVLSPVLDIHMTPSVLDPGLNNPNFLIHPAPMLLNYAEVERREGRLSIMNEGMTPAVLRCLDAMDAEKMAVCTTLGLEAVPIDRVYSDAGGSPSVYRSPGEPFSLTDRIWPRYVDEDVPFGSVLIASFAAHLGVPAPISRGVSDLLAVAAGVDYWAGGRTVQRLGLDHMDAAAISEYLFSGDEARLVNHS